MAYETRPPESDGGSGRVPNQRELEKELSETVGMDTEELKLGKAMKAIMDLQWYHEQLEQVLSELHAGSEDAAGLSPARCPQCNRPLARVSRDEVRPHVPPYVWQTQSVFHRCAACDKIYWPGTHWDHIQETIDRLMG